ncbi:serpin-ZX-like isoform X1 [Rosa chinensis]|uniref:serpin-ZX-like isoform X1 n=1 Tax=Rosa chinensis TaxID=74649 RepID=UPI001AD8E48D|nr:serpin-ZX-like isoform X1 [Rosa chinensis]XP_040367641.1 serpin-ZX-like isoform X1 [Rosa chinensis]
MPQMSIGSPYQKPDSGTTTSVTSGTSITVNPTSGTAVTITPSPGSTVTITISISGSTTINISPTSETTSSNTPSPTGETSSPFSFRLPHPAPKSPSLSQPFNSLDKKPPAVQPIHSTSSSLVPIPVPAQPIEDGVRESIKNQNDVTLGITKQLLLDVGRDNNMVYSPLSIHMVLGLIAAGSTRGTNRDQILNFLKAKSTEELNDFASKLVPLVFADGSPKGGPCLSFSNSVWLDKSLSFKASFKHVVDNAYKAALNQVDFKTKAEEIRCEVNSWAEEETRGLIKEVLPPMSVDSTTRLILANALYFKGDWTEKFDASLTKTDDFHLIDGRSVKAPFMISWNKQFISAFDGFKVLKLPYEQGGDHIRRFSMYVYLPNAIDGLPALVERVCSESGFVDRYLPRFAVKVGRFLIPKFKLSAGFEVKEVLQTLGLDLPLHPGSLSQMVDSSLGLCMSCIRHKSFIEVNEEGTETATVTVAFGLSDCISIRDPPIDFVADHPFLFLIREETSGAVLFIGHVLNPIADQ